MVQAITRRPKASAHHGCDDHQHKKIGNNTGGTSHSRKLDLALSDILITIETAGPKTLAVTDNSRERDGIS